MENQILLDVKGLKKHFPIRKGLLRRTVGWVRAVDGIDFYIRKGETLGLVGESGCGKSTTGKCILRLFNPSGGRILFDGKDITAMNGHELRKYRRRIQAIFQDPYSSLNPRKSVLSIVGEPMRVHGMVAVSEVKDAVLELTNKVGLRPEHLVRYPHEFSGGQRQRIGVARALALKPDLIICDEPVSALDVSIQAQVINLLDDLKKEFNLSYLFVAHDLSVVEHISDRIAVMYLGKIVETAGDTQLYSNPLHPYTQALLSAIPVLIPKRKRKRIILKGDVPSPINPPAGCRFHTRCWKRMDICSSKEPPFREIVHDHYAACHHLD